MFFDHFLKGIDNRIVDMSPVRLELRETVDTRLVRYENEFPIDRTQYKKLYLDARTHTMDFHQVPNVEQIAYDSAKGEVVFVYTFKEDTELAGYMSLNLWVSPIETNDMDIFITVRKLDASGKRVPFYDILGWLRLSCRELNSKLSTPWEPYPAGIDSLPGVSCEGKVMPGQIVPAQIPILPSSFVCHKGETLRLGISGIYLGNAQNEFGFGNTVNKGDDLMYTGGKYDSYLLVPIIPPKEP